MLMTTLRHFFIVPVAALAFHAVPAAAQGPSDSTNVLVTRPVEMRRDTVAGTPFETGSRRTWVMQANTERRNTLRGGVIGGAIGGLLGAAAGGVIGGGFCDAASCDGDTRDGALVGGAIGIAAGAAIGALIGYIW